MDNINYIIPDGLNTASVLGIIILFIPLISFIFINSFSWKGRIDPGWIASGFLGIGVILAAILFVQVWNADSFHASIKWLSLSAGERTLNINLGILLDNVSVMMILVVLIVSFLVHVFSIDYMKGENNYHRYFSYLGFFTFSMLGIVLADNLLMVFIFWELVGFSSWILIGFWFHKPSAAYAARKAFIVNRIGDLGFLVALMILWSWFGTLDLMVIKKGIASIATEPGSALAHGSTWLFIAGLGIFSGAVGKSAQFPLMVWLPDAMEGPTPVSALIHAATMVAAGVYMLSRTYAIFTVPVLDVIAIVGTLTAFMSAVAALTQNDIKKVLAYSTISQLGFMVMGIGVGSREAALFHLFTHAFFKAGLFLCAGMIIKSMHEMEHDLHSKHLHFDTQDMRNFGGLKNKMPVVFFSYTVCSAALAGIPFFTGFLSKDAILVGTLGWATYQAEHGWTLAYLIPLLGFLTALMTAFYIGRSVFLTFFGEFRLQKNHPEIPEISQVLKQRPLVAGLPVLFLSIMSFGIFYSINPLSAVHSWVFQHIGQGLMNLYMTSSLELSHELTEITEGFHTSGAILSTIIALTGISIASWIFMIRKTYTSQYYNSPDPSGFWGRLSYTNWHLDEIYSKIFIKPFTKVSEFTFWIDREIIDRVVDFIGVANVVAAHIIGWFDKNIIDGLVNLSAWLSGLAGKIARSIQSGKIQSYYVWTLTFLILIILWWLL